MLTSWQVHLQISFTNKYNIHYQVNFFHLQLCNYCEFRESNPELHIDVHPFLLTKLCEDDIVSVTPYRDQTGRRVMIYKYGNWRPSKVPVDDIFRVSLLLLEMGSMEPISQVLGGVGKQKCKKKKLKTVISKLLFLQAFLILRDYH